MAHYAFLNKDNIVVQVIVGRDETDLADGVTDWETYYGELKGMTCKRTSYNGNIRKNYAGIGYTYDPDRDAFIAPQPFPSWILNEENCVWESPVPYPKDGRKYFWDEPVVDWTPMNNDNEQTA